ncbi:MAG: IS1096 element passenger TnpR family protein [Actinomycetota bacterium]
MDSSEDQLRRFESIVAGLDDLREQEPRPRLRRPPRDDVAVYRVRVDLDGARPPIWRRLDLRSDITLDVVHKVLQASFGWLDYHLAPLRSRRRTLRTTQRVVPVPFRGR